MLKEIMEQSSSVLRAINNGGRIENNMSVKLGGLDSYKNHLLDANHLIVVNSTIKMNAAFANSILTTDDAAKIEIIGSEILQN
jgi:hypothetical protein